MASVRKRTAQVAAGLATTAMMGLMTARALHGQDKPLADLPRQAQGRERAIRRDAPPPSPDDLQALGEPQTIHAADDPDPPRRAFQPRGVVLDPAEDAEQFVIRTHKEAAERIAALDRETAELKARLAKVEAASARLRAAFGNLGGKPEVDIDLPPRADPLPDPAPPPKEAASDLIPPSQKPSQPDSPKDNG